MTTNESIAEAMMLLILGLPASWLEVAAADGATKMPPRAVKLRDSIAQALRDAYQKGRKDGAEARVS